MSSVPRILQLEAGTVDLARRLVHRDGDEHRLTTKEAELLGYLAARPGQDVSRDELLREVWGALGRGAQTRAPDFVVRRLRAKVEVDPASPRHVQTVHGVGYRYDPLGSARTTVHEAPQPAGASFDPTWYVRRADEERDAEDRLAQPGAPCVISGPRQLGKSWLVQALLRRAAGRADIVAEVDGRLFTATDPLLFLATHVHDAVGLPDAELETMWSSLGSPHRRLTRWMEKHVLPAAPDRLVLVVDGADTLARSGDPHGLFALLRSWVDRTREPWPRLRVLLAVSTEPALLVTDPNLSPFNLSPPIVLGDLAPAQVAELAGRYGVDGDLDALRGLVGGHPWLVRAALHEAASHDRPLADVLADGGVFDEHLRSRLKALRANPVLLDAARALLAGKTDLDYLLTSRLVTAGLATRSDGVPRIRYELYRRFLGEHL